MRPLRWLAPILGATLAAANSNPVTVTGGLDGTCKTTHTTERKNVNVNLNCTCQLDFTKPPSNPFPKSCYPLELVFLLDTSDSVLDDQDTLFTTTKDWIVSTVNKLMEDRKDCGGDEHKKNFVVLFQYSEATHAEYADFVNDDAKYANFEKAISEMVQQKSSTKLYESLDKLVKFYKKYENMEIEKALKTTKINDKSFQNNKDNINEDKWKSQKVMDYEKVLLVLTDGQSGTKGDNKFKTDRLMNDAAEIFKRMDVVLLVDKEKIHDQETRKRQNALYPIWKHGYLHTVQGLELYGFNIQRLAQNIKNQNAKCTVEVAVIIEKKYCQCSDTNYRESSNAYKRAKNFLKTALKRYYYKSFDRTAFKFSAAYYTPAKVASDFDDSDFDESKHFKIGDETCVNEFKRISNKLPQYKNFVKVFADDRLEYPEKALNSASSSFTCAKSDLSFMLEKGRKMFSSNCKRNCKKLLVIASEGQDHRSVWLDHELQYNQNDNDIIVLPMKIGEFGKGKKGNDERFNLEQLYQAPKKLKQENPIIIQAPYSFNKKRKQDATVSLEEFTDAVEKFALVSCPVDPNSPAGPPKFTCGCEFVNNIAPTIDLTVRTGKCGPQGPDGLPGIPGQTGERGDKGKDAVDGEPGIPGVHGPQGPQGPFGPQGNNGTTGERGDIGDKGKIGDTGEPGEDADDILRHDLEAKMPTWIRQLCQCKGHTCKAPPEPPCNMHTVFYIDAGKTTCTEIGKKTKAAEGELKVAEETKRQRIKRMARSMIESYYKVHIEDKNAKESVDYLSMEIIFFGSKLASGPILSEETSEYYVEAPVSKKGFYYNTGLNPGSFLRFDNVSNIDKEVLLNKVDEYANASMNDKRGCGGTSSATLDIMNPLIEIQEHSRNTYALVDPESTHYNLIMISDDQLGQDLERDSEQANKDWENDEFGTYNSGWYIENGERQWKKMLKKLYDPEGRRQNQVKKENREYLFDYVRVAPLLVNLNMEEDSVPKPTKLEIQDHQKKLNDYTSWTRTFFDGSCCAEFAWMGENSSVRCGTKCSSSIKQDKSPVFAVIPGTKECWSWSEVNNTAPADGQPQCIDFKEIFISRIPNANPSQFKLYLKNHPYTEEDQPVDKRRYEENAMYWLIKGGLITCNKIASDSSDIYERFIAQQYDL